MKLFQLLIYGIKEIFLTRHRDDNAKFLSYHEITHANEILSKIKIYQQLDYSNITTDFKKDVLYISFKKPVDQSKLDKLFVKYHVN